MTLRPASALLTWTSPTLLKVIQIKDYYFIPTVVHLLKSILIARHDGISYDKYLTYLFILCTQSTYQNTSQRLTHWCRWPPLLLLLALLARTVTLLQGTRPKQPATQVNTCCEIVVFLVFLVLLV